MIFLIIVFVAFITVAVIAILNPFQLSSRGIKRMIKIIILITLTIIIIIMMLNPLRRSEATIRQNMLNLTPIGMSIEEVTEIIENNERWEIRFINYEFGFATHPSGRPGGGRGSDNIVGEKSIRVTIGSYKFALVIDTSVCVFWGFDENGSLIEVGVRKSADVL